MSDKKSSHAHGMSTQQLQAAWVAFNEALHLTCKGNISELARRINMSPQAVHRWFDRKMIPAHRVIDVVEALEGFVSAQDLRPDVFRIAA